jgi:hypothetical protein
VKKIFSTTNAARTPAQVAPGMIATNIASMTIEPRFAGRTPLSAAPTAAAVAIGGNLMSAWG